MKGLNQSENNVVTRNIFTLHMYKHTKIFLSPALKALTLAFNLKELYVSL